MSYLVISFSHKNLDIKQREKLAFNSDEEKARFIRKLLEAKLQVNWFCSLLAIELKLLQKVQI